MVSGRLGLSGCLVTLGLLLQATSSFACPDDQYEECFLGACACFPKIGGDLGAATEHIKHETTGQVGGAALEAWITASRNSAIGTAEPIPAQIRQALSGYIDQDVMNRARFKVGDNGILNLAGLTIAYGDRIYGSSADAVTLIDLIVFRYANDAYNNPALWAHELAHVQQFRDWGTRDFSIRYARDSGGVENPAYAVGNGYDGWRSRTAWPGPAPTPRPIGFPSGYVMQGCGCWGPNPALGAPEQRCQSGGVRLTYCAGFCGGGGAPYGYVCQ